MKEKWYEFAVAEIEKREGKLNDWEKKFFKDMKRRISVDLSLTTKQESALLKIHAKATGMQLASGRVD